MDITKDTIETATKGVLKRLLTLKKSDKTRGNKKQTSSELVDQVLGI